MPKHEITIYVESDDPNSYEMLQKFVKSLEFLLSWQWNNVAISSHTTFDKLFEK